jgi:uncharacterized protein (TIGR02444 family)
MNSIDTEPGLAKSLWDFSLRLYGEGSVSKALIDLQDRHQADVNVILFLCWLARRGLGPLDEKTITAINAAALPWQQGVIRPLRSVRRQMQAMAGLEAKKVYKSLKASELSAEKAEQKSLVSVLDLVACARVKDDVLAALEGALGQYFTDHALAPRDKKAIKLIIKTAITIELEP